MNKKHLKGWLKHGDFILLDIFCLQLCFVLGYWLIHGYGNPYSNDAYQYQAFVLLLSQLIVILFANNYQGILRRKRFDEAMAVGKYMIEILVVELSYLFLVQHSSIVSRLQFGVTALLFLAVDYLFRCLNKKRIFRLSAAARKKRSIVLITAREFVYEAMEKLYQSDTYQDFFVSGIILMDLDEMDADTEKSMKEFAIPVLALNETAISRISRGWVDETFILQPNDMIFPSKLMDDLMEMGITVNYTMMALNDERWPITDMRKLGRYKVLSTSIRFITVQELAIKRGLDILGGLAGCILTGILCLFLGPAIYLKSPGSIFFAQERIGQNGKKFKMYKFRSMYLNAEEEKADLLAQNKIKDGLMFKMDDDPRIIGSEKKDKNGRPRGIGNFIRRTSLDEFPQFLNVLRGDMSLVGWRPATLDEWKKYDLQHRIRASMKPGLTGMWQVSGRSEITNFNEVVRLDREYIENWSVALDIKILLKTVWVVLSRRGAE